MAKVYVGRKWRPFLWHFQSQTSWQVRPFCKSCYWLSYGTLTFCYSRFQILHIIVYFPGSPIVIKSWIWWLFLVTCILSPTLFSILRKDAYTCWPSNTRAEQFNFGSRIDHILCAGSCLHEDCDPQGHNLVACHVKDCDILTIYKRWKPGNTPR